MLFDYSGLSFVALSSIVSISSHGLVFKTQQSPVPKMIIPLRQGFFLENKESLSLSPRTQTGQKLTSFDLVFPSGFKKEFMFDDELQKQAWFDALSQMIEHFDFDDYEITSPASSLPGSLSLNCFSWKNGESLLLTQIHKKGDQCLSLFEQESFQQSLNSSLEVLKVCEHPLIPRLLQIKESSSYVYIAQEPCYGGDLPSYLEQVELTTRIAKHIVSQMTEVLCFLKKMGISVGNLSLSSFSLAEEIQDFKSLPEIRLSNLREAKIISDFKSSYDFCLKPTLGSAPQVLEQKSFQSFEADAFSFGVILCNLLFKKHPFKSFKEILSEEPSIPQPSCPLGPNIRAIIKSKITLIIRAPRQRSQRKRDNRRFLKNNSIFKLT